MNRSFTAAATDAGQRLDVFLAEKLAPMTRSHIQKLIKDGMVSVGGTPARGSRRLLEGELIEAEIPEPKDAEILPEEKNAISHRGKALRKMAALLLKEL